MLLSFFSVLALFVAQTLMPACFRYLRPGGSWLDKIQNALGPRDHPPATNAWGERSARALTNMHEALPVFLALSLLHLAWNTESELALRGAWIFFGARLFYVPAYLSGVPGLRSACWSIGLLGMAMMAWPLLEKL